MRNVEAKFPLADVAAAHQRATALGFEYIATLPQHDTFFGVPNGKLKLRQEAEDAWLIFYQRHREDGFGLSDYKIVAVSEPRGLRELLGAALGIIAEVRKRRMLLRRANIRLHLDEVQNHGLFGELEAVLGDGQDPVECRREIAGILAGLHIPAEQLIDASYFELSR
jgi:predicted adenylyl cyclase CyaB